MFNAALAVLDMFAVWGVKLLPVMQGGWPHSSASHKP
jgi:hypothetical protein